VAEYVRRTEGAEVTKNQCMPRGDQSGATSVEYGLMAALIAAVIVLAVLALGSATKAAYDCGASKVEGANQSVPVDQDC
jgi:pilus assembly protein Flp/PilA